MVTRIDVYPTHRFGNYWLRMGHPFPFGTTFLAGGINFSVFSKAANYCVLVLYERGSQVPLVEIPFRGLFEKVDSGEVVWGEFRIGNVFCMTVFDLPYEQIEYGFRMDGHYPRVSRGQPGIHRFNPEQVLLDPYAKGIGGRDIWGIPPNWEDAFPHRGRIVRDDFDWEGDRPLEIPLEDLVIYEMHVRSFTQDPTSGCKYPGTFAGIREKIPYLKELGVNCVELMPIFEFDEFENSRQHPQTGELLMNYWGYSTVGFFAPKAGYAFTGQFGDGTQVADELKTLIKDLHSNGIEVILDVVFNHTAEGNEHGPTISYRGIDNQTYYMLTPEGYYFNFSGCGNTLNCNNPVVRNMVLDCLRYWAAEYHIDGFRFDLAAILSRDPWGFPLPNPPLLETLAFDPILGKCKLIAEAWDAGGLYQVGNFAAYGRWAEWNGKYRDTMRKFLKGEPGILGEVAQRLQGSPDLYGGRGTGASINFITCHDGFTLMDLVSYNHKHNQANGEDNRDGSDDNYSWNCGWEGETDDLEIKALRSRQIKNALAILLVSQGVPMLLMGDEMGRTQQGNNNTYCHDNHLNWLDWTLIQKNADIYRFARCCIAFRRAHPALRLPYHPHQEISWHGTQAWNADWNGRVIAFMVDGRQVSPIPDNIIYVALNMYWETLPFELPRLPPNYQWFVFANTGAEICEEVWDPGQEPVLSDQATFLLRGRSVAILVGR
ncbi:MAG: alpha-amylase family glycosyl hydrolase [Thermostichales cyanobacterium HHBFW_bins_127]